MTDAAAHDESHAEAGRIPLAEEIPVGYPEIDATGFPQAFRAEESASFAEVPPGDGMAGFSHMRRIGIDDLLF